MKMYNDFGSFFREKLKEFTTSKSEIMKFHPRPYQKDIIEIIDKNDNPTFICWARRLGKDQTIFAYAVEKCLSNKNFRVVYIFPLAKQGKQNILDGVTFEGKNWIESIVDITFLKRPKSGALYFYDLSIKFKNGSVIQFVGDDANALVGGNINILVLSETAMIKKETFEYMIPSVKKVKGKIICISTPRYGSWFNEMLLNSEAEINKSILRADQAIDYNGERVYTPEELDEVSKIMSKEKFNSEYNVDLTSYNESSIYGRSFLEARKIQFPDLKGEGLFISADLGSTDNSSYTFSIFQNNKLKVIHHYRNRNVPTGHYIDYVNNWIAQHNIPKSFVSIILPQDAKNILDAARYLTSRAEFWREDGFNVIQLNHIGVLRGIEITRTAIESGDIEFVDNTEVNNMINIIKAYEWKKSPQGEIIYTPLHGSGYAASNDADSLEYLSIAFFLKKYEANHTTEGGVVYRND